MNDLSLLLNAARTSPPLRDAVLRVEARMAQLEEVAEATRSMVTDDDLLRQGPRGNAARALARLDAGRADD